jgi:hypothetical protein
MEDVITSKARHGQYPGKGFWWIDHMLVDKKPVSIMVMFGNNIIGDKACYRIGNEPEIFFEAGAVVREPIILRGKAIIRERLKGRDVRAKDGSPYLWDSVN